MTPIKRLSFMLIFFACFFMGDEIKAQKVNQFDANKKRTGIWKKYHSNKRLRYVGAFKNGKEIGVFKFYHITTSKKPVILKTFSKKSDSVFVQFFTVEGILQSEGYFIGKKRVGSWRYLFKDGKILSQENYKNGVLNGELINYYPDKTITELSLYKNGLQHGASKKYSDKGILIEEITYLNGKLSGLAKYFELNGDLRETGNYKDGKRDGKWAYYLDGEMSKKEEKRKFTKKQ
jgi:antitoxin component YwqK of YwqJK toxin-antitoxin module